MPKLNTRKQLYAAVKKQLKGFDLASVSECSGVTHQTLDNWLRSRVRKPHLSALFGVADVIGLPLNETQRAAIHATS